MKIQEIRGIAETLSVDTRTRERRLNESNDFPISCKKDKQEDSYARYDSSVAQC